MMFAKKQDPFFEYLVWAGDDYVRVAEQVCRWLIADVPIADFAHLLQAADTRQQALARQLLIAFMTPIDRRDLFALHRQTLELTRATVLLPLQAQGYISALHRQRSALWVENCAVGAKNVLCTFANYKKYAILQKKILHLSHTATAGLQMCAAGLSSGTAQPLYAALLPVALSARALADVALEVLIANL